MEELTAEITLKKMRLEIWERENPEEVKKLELEIKHKMIEVQSEIQQLVESKVDNYFKDRNIDYTPSYIG